MQNKKRWEPDWFLQSLLNNHIDKLVEHYSCLRAFRTDLFYQDHTAKFFLRDYRQLEAVVGFFWVIEWTEDHHYHAHVVFWLDGSKTQNTYPWAQQAGLQWSDITDRDGWYHRCEFKEHYEADINIPVRYSDPGSIANIRQVLAYMTKIQQKHGLLLYGCNEVPGRPRRIDF
ncbi:conserved hypothetical protein [Xenorhabdus bovienii str. Jollieti]|uniref:Inovirus Gp2 family protein n=1 Tax=Xenorhabdus bovienii (strain SS-2004) TaxID=406818 RepID=D3UW97_XENBS|nr:hypothetical protein [Xenorhabdus bovienii]CBJ79606.1 conserved hypothetical protein [Xenorhabdus bovienii SS-2004]CDH27679.1 conserved hypothetical protein [Xenorhabdus bovienii str. Jollieti]